MSQYSALKAIINQDITTNGRGDITGAILNQLLKDMVSSLGAYYQFAGVATPSTNPGNPDQNVFYIAIKGGNYTNFGNVVIPDGITIFKWNGSWTNQILFAGDGGVFDITAYNNNTKYADLKAALGTNGTNVPQYLRMGGMSVKFVQSSDNKYVQYRLMSDTWSITPSDWQGVDDEPTSGSKNLVTSGGVAEYIADNVFNNDNAISSLQNSLELGSISGLGSNTWTYSSSTTRLRTKEGTYLNLFKGDIIRLTDYTNARFYIGCYGDYTKGSQGWLTTDFVVPVNGKYVVLLTNVVEEIVTVEGLGSRLQLKSKRLGNAAYVGVDQAPTEGSNNAITSGCINEIMSTILPNIALFINSSLCVHAGYIIDSTGQVQASPSHGYSNPIAVRTGQKISINGVGTGFPYFVFCQQDGTFISTSRDSSGVSSQYRYTFNADGYIRINGRIANDGIGVVGGLIYTGDTMPDLSDEISALNTLFSNNSIKYAALRGETFSIVENISISLTVNKLFVLFSNPLNLVTVEDSTTYTLNNIHRFLVLTRNNNVYSIIYRDASSQIRTDEIVLLYYDDNEANRDIVGGILYPHYIKWKVSYILGKNLIKYISTRNAVYKKIRNRGIEVTLNTLFINRLGDTTTVTITDSDAYMLNSSGRFLVLAADNSLQLRGSSFYVKYDDCILLYYDDAVSGDIVGGALYADYLNCRISEFNSMLPENLGQVNCVRKAKQMALVKWTPKLANTIPNNTGSFPATQQQGMIYSSAKEYSQFVFEDVSLETFMTAVNNPRSVLYTENISVTNSRSALGRRYYGVNCAAYYGSVCSGLLTYAYGIPQNITTYEFRSWERMEVIEDQSSYGLKIGDAIWQTGHIQLVTGITKDQFGIIKNIEIVENAGATTVVKNWTDAELQAYMSQYNCVILRYKDLYANYKYTPLTSFVTVNDEAPASYSYNDDICPNYGDKSNYNEGDDVVLNLRTDYALQGFTKLEVYKDDGATPIIERAISNYDETLTGLTHGDYKARIVGTSNSEYCNFKVVNVSVVKNGSKFTFSSLNSTPLYYEFCDLQGRRSYDIVGLSTHTFTSEELTAGEATPTGSIVATGNFHYLKVHFSTSYGRVIKVINWNA